MDHPTTKTYESIRVEITENIAEVTLVGPGKGNAMGPAFFRELPELMAALDHDDGVRVVIVRGHAGVFTYGLDLKAVAPDFMPLVAQVPAAADRKKLLRLIGEWQRGFDLVERCEKPVIAAIAGPCIGGGVDLASACDIRLASKDARFSVREVKVAIVADLGSLQRLPRIIGHGHTRELAFTGKDIDAARAMRIGLVNDVYDDEAKLLEAARALAKEIAENSPLVVGGIKSVLRQAEERHLAEQERFVAVWNAAFLASNDLKEAMQSFFEKRKPNYTGT